MARLTRAVCSPASQAMESGHYRNVPLMEPDGTVVGLLRQQDLIEFMINVLI